MIEFDSPDDELRDEEYPDDEDGDDGSYDNDDDPVDTIACPECGAEIYEHAEQCPACGMYITPDLGVWEGRSWWWIALGGLGIAAVIFYMVLAGFVL